MRRRDKPQQFAPANIPIRADWLSRHEEAILEPDLAIVDPHHHLWDRPGQRYLFNEFLQDAGSGHKVEATVYIQARSMYRVEGPLDIRAVGETEFANGIAAQSASGIYGDIRVCAGIVGYADLALGAPVERLLEAHIRAAPDRFRGVRAMVASHVSDDIAAHFGRPPLGLMQQKHFREGFARLGGLGLSFDAFAYQTQLDEVLDLARAFPETSIVLNHAGGILGVGPYGGRRAEFFAEWRDNIRPLASCPNVTVKLGGFAMHSVGFDFHESVDPPGSQTLAQAWKPYVDTCIEAFGAARCMFESNFPVDKGMVSYAVMWNAFKRLVEGASIEEKAALFGGTARRVYRLDA
jgi:L-fuconolactonase